MLTKRQPWVAAVVGVGLALGLVGLQAGQSDGNATVPANPTFSHDVLPILQRSCQNCHRPRTIAPMSLLTYQDVRPWARAIRMRVVERYMPPWHLDPTVGIKEYKNNISLSDEEIATIARWVDQGAPQGNPADAPPPMKFSDENVWYNGEEPDLIVSATPTEVDANVGDLNVRSGPFDTGLTEDRYIKWIQVIPGDATVVHHALVNAQQSGGTTAANVQEETVDTRRLGFRSPAGYSSMLIEYVRGNNVDIFDEDASKIVRKDAKITFSFHYHGNGKATAKDASKLGIKFFPRGVKPKHLIVTHPLNYRPGVIIPPHDPNARSDAYFTLGAPTRLISFQPHMHYRGRRMVLEAITPDGRQQILTDVPRFTWIWQVTYPVQAPAGVSERDDPPHDRVPRQLRRQ